MWRITGKAEDRTGRSPPPRVGEAPPAPPPRPPDADVRFPWRVCVLIIGLASLGLWGVIGLLLRAIT